MPLTEFDIIARFFSQSTASREDVVLGIGDDAALIQPPADQQLVIAIDTLVCGVHFPVETDPYDIGWKALAVNLSDLAAMGAQPAWFTLALTLEDASEAWLSAFSRGLSDLANPFGVQLIGGDTTRGPLTVTIQVGGYVPANSALTRRGAQAGDEIWVSGTLGDAALALRLEQGAFTVGQDVDSYLRLRLDRPQPRLQLGMALRHIASSCIDISDGLLADLEHLCEAGACGAQIQHDSLPLSDAACQTLVVFPDWSDLPLSGGDDYELCFTVPESQHESVLSLGRQLGIPLTCLGEITTDAGVRCLDKRGREVRLVTTGYRHFGDS